MFARVPLNRGIFRAIRPHVEHFKGKTRGGEQRIELPQFYRDWSLMLGHFPASAAAIARLLPPDSGLEPVTIGLGFGVVTLAAFDYRQPQTLAPYKEMGVMFPVRYRPIVPVPAVPLFRPEWFSDLGFYIWKLPVTTQEACDAGTDLWAFPKSLAGIEFDERGDRRRCAWYEGKQHVLTLEVRTSPTSVQLRNFLAYSVLDGRLQQTLVQTVGEYDESRFGFDAAFALGDAEVARQMRDLGMIGTPVGRLYSPRAQGVLPGPSAVPFSSVPALARSPRVLRSMVGRVGAPARSRVAVFGGGVAGLSAAHELAERGFRVAVYEAGTVGGKARSFGVKGSAGPGRPPLPAEHGFRFFPGFYRHLPDTMTRIPRPGGGTVADNLVTATRLTVELVGDANLVFPARLPMTPGDVSALFSSAALLQQRTGCTADEIAYYIERIWQLLTSCRERRLEEYEGVSWWSFVGAEGRSAAYQRLASTTRTLVAADPKTSSTRTVGNILLQMLFDFATPGASVDRVLNGPTSEVWIEPWVAHLREELDVEFHEGELERIELGADGRVGGVIVGGASVRADHYVAAVPVERMAAIIVNSPGLTQADPSLNGVVKLSQDVDTMAGIQFYFDEPLPVENGHLLHLDSEWALTSLAQGQFWTRRLTDYGDGTVRDILSVDISDFHTPGNGGQGRPAKKSTRPEIEAEVWRQLQESLPFLKSMKPVRVQLDPAIQNGRPNREPLLVNKVHRWHLRPTTATAIPNLFLASDYVRTNTDLATMEGANEAARRAVNAILEATGSLEPPCVTWDLHEPAVLTPWRLIDRARYQLRRPWNSDFPLALRAVELGLTAVNTLVTTLGFGVAPEAAPAVAEVPPSVQAGVGDVLEGVISALRQGRRPALERFFAPHAVITLGLTPLELEDCLPLLRRIHVTTRALTRLYQRGGRVHVVLEIDLTFPDERTPDTVIAGHVHVVLVCLPRPGKRAGERWRIASLRYRRAGAPARLEVPRGRAGGAASNGHRRPTGGRGSLATRQKYQAAIER